MNKILYESACHEIVCCADLQPGGATGQLPTPQFSKIFWKMAALK